MLTDNVKVTMVEAGAVAGTSALTSDEVDMAGFEGVVFVGSIATYNAGNYAKVQQDTVTGMGSAADLAGTKVIPGDSGDSFMIEVKKPLERFLRCVVTRTASTATGDIYAIQYGAKKAPTSHGATVDCEQHVTPSEGTA